MVVAISLNEWLYGTVRVPLLHRYARIHTRIHTHIHTNIHIHTQSHTYTHTHKHMCTHTQTYTQTYTYTHMYTQSSIHTCFSSNSMLLSYRFYLIPLFFLLVFHPHSSYLPFFLLLHL